MKKTFIWRIFPLVIVAIIFVLMGKSNALVEEGGARIVFSAFLGKPALDIFSMDIEGKNLKNLTNHPAIDQFPSPSPNRKYMAFTSDRNINGKPQIFIMDSNGKNPKLLIDDIIGAKPTWSPDNRWVAFAKGPSSIIAVNLNSGEVKKIFEMAAGIIPSLHPVSWSPDGKKIAFWAHAGLRRQGGDIYTMDIDDKTLEGKNLKQLTQEPETYDHPSWSPDGKQIAFWSSKDGGGIFIMDSDGANVKQIYKNRAVCCPVWSPDGKKIIFATGDGIFVMNSDGSDVRQVLSEGSDPSWLGGESFNIEAKGKWTTTWGKIKAKY